MTQVERQREREREGVEGNPSPVYEVQRGMISYNWGGLEGQGSVESAVHIEHKSPATLILIKHVTRQGPKEKEKTIKFY